MAKSKSIKRIWHPRDSGLVVPEGTISDLLLSSSESYLKIKEKARAIESLYAANKVSLPPTSDLARLLTDAAALSDAWFAGQEDKLSVEVLFRAAHLNRIADALLSISMVPHRNVFLAAFASGSLDLLDRKQSTAKDYLWELELWLILMRSSFDAILEEPPDIVVRFVDCSIGIACKKIYSERHVQNVLSQAVAQIEGEFDYGIVAVNIDDLVAPNKILRVPNQEILSEYISNINARFIKSHERHFRKYLTSERLIAAFISTSVLADVYQARVRFNNSRQSTVWALPNLSPDKKKVLRRFYDGLMGQ